MKSLSLLVMLVFAGFLSSAQEQSPLPRISKQMGDYFSAFPNEKIYVTTDKSLYRPGETVWFRAFVTDWNHQSVGKESGEIFVKLYDSKGKSEVQELFKLNSGSVASDLTLPKELAKGEYFLCVYSALTIVPEDVAITRLSIDPWYSNQWVVEASTKDKISVSGRQNEFSAILRDLSGEIQKNAVLRFQLKNGENVIDKGKVKTDAAGKLTISFTLPSKSNGEPFVCELSANRDDWQSESYLPSSLDPVEIKFFPEGGTLIPGVQSKIGFTAFNKWGIAVEVEGNILNQEGQSIAQIKTFTKGLGLFSVENAANQKYKLVLSGVNGQNQSFDLPVPNEKGLALSIVKYDAEFVTSNLIFADKQKHSIALSVSRGSTIYWAADMDLDKSGRIKIPVANLPQGINLLSVFSKEGEILAERIVFVDKKQELKLQIDPEKSTLLAGGEMKVKVRLTDENNQPVSGNVAVMITNKSRLNEDRTNISEGIMIESELETPFSLISDALKGRVTQTTLLDVYLIANRLKGFSWAEVLSYSPVKENGTRRPFKIESDRNFESKLAVFIAGFARKYSLSGKENVPDPAYFANNEELFQNAPKVFKANTTALDNQRKMFASATSIMDVIKTLKPYKIVNNQIVFIGSENSLNYQGGALIVLDGQQLGTDISALSSISPMEVDHINVSTNPMDIQRYTGLNSVGIIEIFQKKAPKLVETPSESSAKYDHGYRIPGKFSTSPVNPKRDTRTTLLWIPEQIVDKTGQFEFSVTAGKVKSDFVVEVQGISDGGLVGSGKGVFTVGK
ncbi:MAG: MG2 domain-containing protein [Bacteroidia bacterium]|nr:MG2 domain-containing protein [Bacteroidia bacterium]